MTSLFLSALGIFGGPMPSGWIAGERLMGGALAAWTSGPEIVRALLGR